MSDPGRGLHQRLADLRESFDRGFAQPPVERLADSKDFLIIRAGGRRYAVVVEAILGVEHHRRIVPLPLQAAGLLGVAGVRGHLTPVFHLASLLNGGAPAGAADWLLLCKGDAPIALAFEGFETAARVAHKDIHASPATDATSPLVRQAARLDSGVVCVIDIPSVVAAAGRRLGRDL